MSGKGSSSSVMLFLLGLFSQTQVYCVAFIDITELVSFLLAPYFFLTDFTALRRHKFMTFLTLWLLTVAAAMLQSWLDSAPFAFMARGVMTPYAVCCLVVVFHHFLSRDIHAFKWFFLGAAISGVLCLFVLQRGTAKTAGGEFLSNAEALEHAAGYSLFWFIQLSTWLSLPIFFCYLKLPKIYSLGACSFLLVYAVFSAGSRSSLGVLMASFLLLMLGGKSQRKLLFIKKNFTILVIVGLVTVPLLGATYKYLALKKYLGEAAYEKYMQQSHRGSDMLSLLMAGRSGFFMGVMSAWEHPLLGHGYMGIDKEGVVGRFLAKYGSEADVGWYQRTISKYGFTTVPTHSWLVSFWEWYGICGLLAMLYVGWLMFSTLKNRMQTIPELYGYFAYFMVGQIWAWLFSPFGSRSNTAFFFALMLIARAVHERRMPFAGVAGARTEGWR